MLLALLLSCTDTPDGIPLESTTGVWLKIRPPPGIESYDCWAFVVGRGAQMAWGGPACFPQAPQAPVVH